MRRAISFALLALSPLQAVAQVPDMTSFYEGFLQPIERRGQPIFLASCQRDGERYILYFEPGQAAGQYAEFDKRGLQINGAGVPTSWPPALEDLMGGIASITIHTQLVEGLLRSDFRLVYAGRMKAALQAMPVKTCVKPHLP